MDEYHQQLLDPDTYPESTTRVDFLETHISRLYLTDRRVYKLKKPLDLGFLDFTSLDKRGFFCNEEVRLNRRFNPDTYLGVFELRRRQGRVRFYGPGQLIDYAVGMQRLPADLMLERLIATEASILPEEMPRLARRISALFNAAEVCQGEEPPNAVLVARNCRENLAETEHFPESLLLPEAWQLMHQWTGQDLETHRNRFSQREAGGFVRDGHGDLHTGNICMTEPIRVYDCIEFNRRFRVADFAADLAFLLMDLEYHDRRDLAAKLLERYLEQSGDQELQHLLPFYKRYRAWVRGKVEGLLYQDSDAATAARKAAASSSRRHFNLALGYGLPPTLFLTCGLMGSGKTTLARALSEVTGAGHLRSDEIRKQLAGIPVGAAVPMPYRSGLYAPEMTKRTYLALLESAKKMLLSGRSVIADASFSEPRQRHMFAEMAADTGRNTWIIHPECPTPAALQRLDQRTGDASDGRRALYHRQKADFVAPSRAEGVIAVDSTRDVDYNVQTALCRALANRPEDFS